MGWPSTGSFTTISPELLDEIKPSWETDGLRLLESHWTGEMIQLLFSTKPLVSPVRLATRAKGRLDHALRNTGHPMKLSRKVSVRSIGENARRDVERYIERQVRKERFADPRFEQFMGRFTVVDHSVDLSTPQATLRGRYWYNLHLVLVVEERWPITDEDSLQLIRDRCRAIAEKKGYAISRLAVMPDHCHVAIRGYQEHSPAEIAGAFQNNLAYAMGQKHIWEDTFYVGTFGDYDMNAVRRRT
jgi:REP element-mobilizing transposase RayT